jgi:aminomethyltransferase
VVPFFRFMTSSPTTSLLQTPLLQKHLDLGAKVVPFAGWSMPLDYGSILEESKTVRAGAGLFDVGHMARFRFRGENVAQELDAALGGRVEDQEIGMARYTMLLQKDGGILDDLITYRISETEYFMVVNASNRERDADILRQRISTTSFEDETEDGGGILALQGPDSLALLQNLTGQTELAPPFLGLAFPDSPLGTLFVARTGYTGEHGYEIFVTAAQAVPVWEKLLELGARPVGLGARDVLRLEAALPLYGHEIHEAVTPFEAGLRFGVRGWKTRDFIGGDALRQIDSDQATQRSVVGLSAEKRVPREGYPLLCEGVEVGVVCSGVWSASLNRPIATAFLQNGVDGPLTVSARGKEFPVKITDLPFVPHRSRN